MNKFVNGLINETNITTTENGDVAFKSTLSNVLDFFVKAQNSRFSFGEAELLNKFLASYKEDKELTSKVLFYMRDIRGGQGNRDSFRTLLNYLVVNKFDDVDGSKLVDYVVEYGRWDDLWSLIDSPLRSAIFSRVKSELSATSAEDQTSLLYKWLPSINGVSSSTKALGKAFAKELGLNEAQYRKLLSAKRALLNILETNMTNKSYDKVDYSAVPSQAALKYRKAFFRNDKDAYQAFIKKVEKGEVKINADTLIPVDLYSQYNFFNNDFMSYGFDDDYSYGVNINAPVENKSVQSVEALWNALPNYLPESGELIIPVVDTSSSMWLWNGGLPHKVAHSLGIYISQRLTGPFKDKVISFSAEASYLDLAPFSTMYEKGSFLVKNQIFANTNIESVFKLILNTGINNKLSSTEMPAKILIISDMHFDQGSTNSDLSTFASMKKLYSEHGYTLPQIVFWDVRQSNTSFPMTMNDQGAILVSGYNPSILKYVLSGSFYAPIDGMMAVLDAPRYKDINFVKEVS